MRSAMAVVSALLAIAYVTVRPAPSRGALPSDPRALAARVEAHPADWLAASALAEKALDAPVRDPLALWHASGELAISLAPWINEPRASFARAAFFHWPELSAADRKEALDAYAPLLRDASTFEAMAAPLFALSEDMGYLRRVRPPGRNATDALARIAVMNGLFSDYRALRAELPGAPLGSKIDSREIDARKEVTIVVAAVKSDEVPPYVEIRVDDVLRDEGPVDPQHTFTLPLTGKHTVAVWLVNPQTRNQTARGVRVSSLQTL